MTSFVIGDKENPLGIIRLIDGSEAIQEFSKVDQYLANMSEFDLQARLQTSDVVNLGQYIKFITRQLLPWKEEHIKLIAEIVNDLNGKSLDILKFVKLPKEILIVLTNGNDEAGAAYCRNLNMIVLPITKLNPTDSNIAQLASGNEWHTTIPHELFHIISRNNPELRDKLYKCIGYNPIPNNKIADLPIDLAHLKITNPDAPITQHYIELHTKNSKDKKLCLAPVLLASQTYSCDKYASFFDYLQMKFLVLDDDWQVVNLLSYDDVIGLDDLIGKNTDYIMHPEEILADNFVLLVMHEINVPSPHILSMMMDIFKECFVY